MERTYVMSNYWKFYWGLAALIMLIVLLDIRRVGALFIWFVTGLSAYLGQKIANKLFSGKTDSQRLPYTVLLSVIAWLLGMYILHRVFG